MIHEKLSGAIIGAAMTVLNELGPGLDEKLYERALVIELKKRGHRVEQQRSFPVHYAGELIGNLIPDTIVDGLVIADPKVVEALNAVLAPALLPGASPGDVKLSLPLGTTRGSHSPAGAGLAGRRPNFIWETPQQAAGNASVFNETHVRQMIGYLAISQLQLALLLNFKRAKLEWKRIVREHHD